MGSTGTGVFGNMETFTGIGNSGTLGMGGILGDHRLDIRRSED
jgi:hypothetical protein